MNRRSHSYAGMLVAVIALLAPSGARPALADTYALVVGVNECPRFRFADGTAVRPLRGAERDATSFGDLLVGEFRLPARHVQVLCGAEATHAAIQNAFRDATQRLGAKDTFLFYFAGHGTQIPDQKPFDEPDGLDEALCSADTTSAAENLVVDDELGLWLEGLPTHRVTVILDCCHSGDGDKVLDDEQTPRYLPLLDRSSTKPKDTWRELAGSAKSLDRQTVALFACHPEQRAYERRLPGMVARQRAGQFSHYLLEGLHAGRADADQDGIVTSREALDYARGRLDATFNRDRKTGELQEPLLEATNERAALIDSR